MVGLAPPQTLVVAPSPTDLADHMVSPMNTNAVAPSRPSRSIWRAVGAIVATLAIVSGVLGAISLITRNSEQESQTYYQQVSHVVATIDTGDIAVISGDDSSVTISRYTHWSMRKPTIEESWLGDTLTITASCPNLTMYQMNCGVDYSLTVPPGVTLDIKTNVGDVSVTGIQGNVTMSSDTGDVSASSLGSPQVTASTDVGDVSLGFSIAPTTVAAESDTGDVSVVVPDDQKYSVETDTEVGEVSVTIGEDSQSDRSISASTDVGDVTIRVS